MYPTGRHLQTHLEKRRRRCRGLTSLCGVPRACRRLSSPGGPAVWEGQGPLARGLPSAEHL